MKANIIATYGLTETENEYIRKAIPQKECIIMDTDVATDIIATAEFAVVFRAEALKKIDFNMLMDFYGEIAPFSESVIAIGDIVLPDNLKCHIAQYKIFDDLKENLKFILLSAYRKQKKSENFSATLANAIRILSEIRKKLYVTSMELAEMLELSQRSVQRYIETLRVAGEWIEYDPLHRGWTLSEGKSILWGDF